jgi:hypothetical protein
VVTQVFVLAALFTRDVLPRALRDLYNDISRTTEGYISSTFLNVLRQILPQFGEVDRSGKNVILGGFAQQGERFSAVFLVGLLT